MTGGCGLRSAGQQHRVLAELCGGVFCGKCSEEVVREPVWERRSSTDGDFPTGGHWEGGNVGGRVGSRLGEDVRDGWRRRGRMSWGSVSSAVRVLLGGGVGKGSFGWQGSGGG